jgi:N-acetylneuraminic acid mutarotase
MSSRTPLHLALSLTALALLACDNTTTPTQPEMAGTPPPPALSLTAAVNSWTAGAPTPYSDFIYGYALGMAPNSAGQSIVYTFGGTSSDEGGTGMTVKAYNVATNTWTGKQAQVVVFYSNGVGKIGSRLYFSGGYVNAGSLPDASRELWAYDYSSDRMIKKANLPIFSAEGVSGVINNKLYVLPGACNGNGYPNAGYCATEATRRFYRYDPATNTLVSRRAAPHFHRRGAAAVLDGKLYVTGGFGASGEGISALDVYDPATNTWSTLAPVPGGGAARAGAALQGQFFVLVGGSPNRAYAYNRFTNQWKAKAAPEIFGSTTLARLNDSPRLVTATGSHTLLYTP